MLRRSRVVSECVPFSGVLLDLSLAAPDALDEAVALRQAVHGIVALAHRSHEAAEGVDVVLAGDGAAVLVDLGDGDLDGAVVLGLDDAVGGAALAGDVAGTMSFSISAGIRLGEGAHTGPRSHHGRSPFRRCLEGCLGGELVGGSCDG
jgi:hypothetical protein